ncbi:MAG: 5-amino-6-(D-ribitylamino)uracil--L-tyrosine 4-hydroxyphenyl transferase CofH [Dehalococcoidia bacterium]|nr:5-amino-6-(D-ribitylamino)uracil--L-tyrosine 4-hydroxyphenyl transferase CofH [Dehalococcoidia bacterium]
MPVTPHDTSGNGSATALEHMLKGTAPQVSHILNNALEGRDISVEDALVLFDTSGLEFNALVMTADELRRRRVGDIVTYVVNRNINFTNVCIKRCGFCAFSRDHREEEGYFLPLSEIIRRAREAWELGATEVCVQAGLPPQMEGDLYIRLCEAIKTELPDMHIHGFSPEEVLYGSVRSKCSTRDYLVGLKDAGVGSLPGTSAEILDQEMRDMISPGRITVDQWIEVITNAHDLGIPTTSTIMYGHVETHEHIARHLALLRDIQKGTGGFTEFVPLIFVASEAPMYSRNLVEGVREGPTGNEVTKVHAISRLMLDNWIPNLQVSWVKESLRFAQTLLNAGVNDMGGTLINESISTSAGAQFGQLVRPGQFRQLIRDAGRIPAERHTIYNDLRVFEDPDQDPVEPLDMVGDNPEEQFGSYFRLIKMDDFRFKHPKHAGQSEEGENKGFEG